MFLIGSSMLWRIWIKLGIYIFHPLETRCDFISKNQSRGSKWGEKWGIVEAKSCFFRWIWTKLGIGIFHTSKTNTGMISYRKTNPSDQIGEGWDWCKIMFFLTDLDQTCHIIFHRLETNTGPCDQSGGGENGNWVIFNAKQTSGNARYSASSR